MTVLGARKLRQLIYHTKDLDKRLVVTPILDLESQISDSAAAIDIRLGTKFIIPKRADVSVVDPGRDDFAEQFAKSFETVNIPYGKALILHPRQFVLGNSLEYFRFPPNLSGYVISRSSWGRLGLVVATAIGIHPGYCGVLCLELSNLAEVPMSLYPGLSIAQVFFNTVTKDPAAKRAYSAYLVSTEVELPRFEVKKEIEKIRRLGYWGTQ